MHRESAAGRRRGGRHPGRPLLPGAGRERPVPLQYASALTTSPWFRVPIAHQVCRLIVSLTNRTEPSQKPTITPPGWLLLGVIRLLNPPGVPPSPSEVVQVSLFGALK